MSRILSQSFVWIGSATHSTSDAFRQRQRERMTQAQRAEVTRQPLPQNPDSVHFSVEHPDGTVTDYGLKPSPFARKEGK